MVIQDPNFWRRFSTAVHQDDFAKDHQDLKHSYVDPSPASSAPMSPSSQCQLFVPSSPVLARSGVVSMPPSALRREQIWQAEIEAERRGSAVEMRQKEKVPSKLKKSASRASTRPLLHQRNKSSVHWPSSLQSPTLDLSTPSPAFHTTTLTRPPSLLAGLRSPSSLSLSGRPRTLFKTWTTITGPANVCPHSESWLAGQKKKSRQRTWICWCFWLGLIALVAGVVVAVLVLRSHGILKF
jgi:hypothetical protein